MTPDQLNKQLFESLQVIEDIRKSFKPFKEIKAGIIRKLEESSIGERSSQRLELAEDLSRRLFFRVQQLEQSHLGSPVPEPYLLSRTTADQHLIDSLSSKIKLLESESLTSKIKIVTMDRDRIFVRYNQLAGDYTKLSSIQSENAKIRALSDRVITIERERNEEIAALNSILFETENCLCASKVENKILLKENAELQASLAEARRNCREAANQ